MIRIAISQAAFEAIASTLPLALWPNPDQALRRAFSRAKDRYLVQLESRRSRQPSLARHCSLLARHAASGSRLASRPRATARTSPLPQKPRNQIPSFPARSISAADEIEKAGGKALPLTVDVRDEAQVRAALEKTAASFGGIDIVVNNASAISLTQVAGD